MHCKFNQKNIEKKIKSETCMWHVKIVTYKHMTHTWWTDVEKDTHVHKYTHADWNEVEAISTNGIM